MFNAQNLRRAAQGLPVLRLMMPAHSIAQTSSRLHPKQGAHAVAGGVHVSSLNNVLQSVQARHLHCYFVLVVQTRMLALAASSSLAIFLSSL